MFGQFFNLYSWTKLAVALERLSMLNFQCELFYFLFIDIIIRFFFVFLPLFILAVNFGITAFQMLKQILISEIRLRRRKKI